MKGDGRPPRLADLHLVEAGVVVHQVAHRLVQGVGRVGAEVAGEAGQVGENVHQLAQLGRRDTIRTCDLDLVNRENISYHNR